VSQMCRTGSFHDGRRLKQQMARCWHPIGMERHLTFATLSVQDGVRQIMNFSRKIVGVFSFAACLLLAPLAVAQNPPASDTKPQAAPPKPEQQTRITIEVKGGDSQMPVENASVYVKFIEEHKIKKNKTLEMNVKTNRDGIAHVPDAPLGRALIQVVAEGWKPFGRWFDISDPAQTFKVHLERPPKWY
jgi:hypothetical protein